MLQRKNFKSHFLHYSCPPLFSLYPHFSLSRSPSFSLSHFLSLSPFLSLSLSSLLYLSYGFCLDWVLADVKNGFANCNFFF